MLLSRPLMYGLRFSPLVMLLATAQCHTEPVEALLGIEMAQAAESTSRVGDQLRTALKPKFSGSVWTVRSEAGQLQLMAPDGAALLALVPDLMVGYGAEDQGPQRRRRSELRRVTFSTPEVRVTATGWRAEAAANTEAARYRMVFQGDHKTPRVDMHLEVEYRRNTLVQAETLRWVTTEHEARVLNREYHWVSAAAPKDTLVGRLTPKQVRFSQGDFPWTFQAPDAQGIWIRRRDGLVLEAELDHRENHPFKVYAGCPTRKKRPSKWLDESIRRVGERSHYAFSWLLSEASLPWVRRYPEGYNAAFVLTDHADRGSKATTEAFAYGETGALGRAKRPARGFVGRGLGYTKTVFVEGGHGYKRQLDHGKFVELADAMQRDGVELGVHSTSPVADVRETTRSQLETYAERYTGRTWIDHRPTDNCEAISNRGWDPKSPHYIVDLLEEQGFDTLWAVEEYKTKSGTLNLLRQGASDERRSILYHHSRLGTGLFEAPLMFVSNWYFHRWGQMLSRARDAHLDALAAEHGLFIGHTYLDISQTAGVFAGRSLLRRKKSGGFEVRPEMDALFAEWEVRQKAGDILFAGVETVGHHTMGAMGVSFRPDAVRDGIWVEYDGRKPLKGLTVRLPPHWQSALVDGMPPAGSKSHATGIDIWFDLQPGERRFLSGEELDEGSTLTKAEVRFEQEI